MRLRSAARPVLVAAVVGLAGPARAGPELALRLGLAFPTGDAAPGVPLSDEIGLQLPIQIDGHWRAGRMAAGLYGSWGPGLAGNCVAGASCSASVWRAGAQATYAFPRRGSGESPGGAEPWAGLAAGWEWATRRQSTDAEVSTAWSGPEVSLQGGVEWRVGRRVAVGPLLLVGLGRYRDVSVETDFDSGSAELSRRSTHAWIQLAVRARLALGGDPEP